MILELKARPLLVASCYIPKQCGSSSSFKEIQNLFTFMEIVSELEGGFKNCNIPQIESMNSVSKCISAEIEVLLIARCSPRVFSNSFPLLRNVVSRSVNPYSNV